PDPHQHAEESVEDRRLTERVVDAALPAKRFGDGEGGRERDHGGRGDRRAEEAEREDIGADLPHTERPERLRDISGRTGIQLPRPVQRRRRANNNEEDDDVGERAPEDHVLKLLLVSPDRYP